MIPAQIDLGFHFYGSGNIGDDLMLAGFLQGLKTIAPEGSYILRGVSAFDLASQRRRFPEISWSSVDEMSRWSKNGELWLGVGDTPFQITSGPWFLEYLEAQRQRLSSYPRKLLLGVGAESEIATHKNSFSTIANCFDLILTRDRRSSHILTEMLGVPQARVIDGGDLAHIGIPDIAMAVEQMPRRYGIGLNVTVDTLSPPDLAQIKRFVLKCREPIAFVANDVRPYPNFESGIYATLAPWPWSPVRRKAPLLLPDYRKGLLHDLLKPLAHCETVISSRYHGLMAAAWLGRKVAAIVRSSKIGEIVEEMGIPVEQLPLSAEKLERLQHDACIVPRATLESHRVKAILGLRVALNGVLA